MVTVMADIDNIYKSWWDYAMGGDLGGLGGTVLQNLGEGPCIRPQYFWEVLQARG